MTCGSDVMVRVSVVSREWEDSRFGVVRVSLVSLECEETRSGLRVLSLVSRECEEKRLGLFVVFARTPSGTTVVWLALRDSDF
jgi:hypothetical protein